ncbi:lathosterol oxidase-like [Liolophura sinensis]|uniref:lathosterol oxidase-like n=1 Tax=Liolophura sinensis TaxID=3198878 RepID=UPI00315808E2
MDVVLNLADYYVLTPYVYPDDWREDDRTRQLLSLLVIANVGGFLIYLITAVLSYYLIYDHRFKKHVHFLENQVQREILCAVNSLPLMSIPTTAMFYLEVRGYSKLYDNVQDTEAGWYGVVGSVFAFILFTDFCVYWIHRFLHHKMVYKHLHKTHHKWKIPTPFASHAFHPIDGFLQSFPYHLYPFIFPLHKFTYLGLFIFVNIWSVSIHDGDYRVPDFLKPVINGSAHHTDHHTQYNYNYGMYFTFWDRIGGSFRIPSSFTGCGPLDDVKKKEMEADSKNFRAGKSGKKLN